MIGCHNVNLYCICQSPEDGDMIGCHNVNLYCICQTPEVVTMLIENISGFTQIVLICKKFQNLCGTVTSVNNNHGKM